MCVGWRSFQVQNQAPVLPGAHPGLAALRLREGPLQEAPNPPRGESHLRLQAEPLHHPVPSSLPACPSAWLHFDAMPPRRRARQLVAVVTRCRCAVWPCSTSWLLVKPQWGCPTSGPGVVGPHRLDTCSYWTDTIDPCFIWLLTPGRRCLANSRLHSISCYVRSLLFPYLPNSASFWMWTPIAELPLIIFLNKGWLKNK